MARAWVLLIGCWLAAPALAALPLVPPAQDYRDAGQSLSWPGPVRIDSSNTFPAQLLADELLLQGVQSRINRSGGVPLQLGLWDEPATARALRARGLTESLPSQAEAYLISITPRGVLVAGRDSAGLFYGVQTLRQLVRVKNGRLVLPEALIRDWPAMAFRGLSVDLGQGVVPTEAQMRRIIQTCAEYKLNLVSFYMQHLVAFQSTPLLPPPAAELDPRTIRNLVAFAARHHVTLLPQQQTFGHLHHLLKHELYSPLGEVPHGTTLTAGDPAARQWVEGVADELTALFPGTLFHAGGDETWDLGKGVNRDAVAAQGQGKLWAAHMSAVADILRRHERRMLFWGDRPLKAPEIIPQLPRDSIAATWAYNANEKFPEFISPFRQAGLDVIVCPSANNWSKPAPDFDVAVTNIGRFVAEGVRQHALGMLNTIWFDDGESLFDVTWYPIVYSASAAWAGADLPRDSFDAAFDWAFYRADSQAFASAIHRLGEVHAAARRAGFTDAANEYLWLDPYSSRGARTYARLAPQARTMRLLAEESLTLLRQNRSRCRLHTETVAPLEFAARRMDWLGMKVLFCAEISASYRDAFEHPDETRRVNYALLNISDINGRMQDLRDIAGEMKDAYRALWLSANRPYFLNGMLALYDRELLYWLNKADRIAEARATFRQNHSLPSPTAIGLSEP